MENLIIVKAFFKIALNFFPVTLIFIGLTAYGTIAEIKAEKRTGKY